MKYKYVIFLLLSLLLCSSFSLPTVFAESEIISIEIDNQRKIAYPNQLVQFTMEVTNNSSSKENFIIRHAQENSILWLPMNIEMGDDNQKVYDSSPFGNYGTLHNFSGDYGLTHTDKLDHEAILFDGDDDYVEVPYSSSLDVSMVTLACWVKISENQEDWQTIVCCNGATEHYEMQMFPSTDANFASYVKFQYSKSGHTKFSPNTGQSLVDDMWHYIAGTYDGSKAIMYLDGSEISSSNYVGSLENVDGVVRMGTLSKSKYFSGIIDEVRIYNRALTANEIKWLYNCNWRENLSNYNVELNPSESTQVTFNVKVPNDVEVGHVQKFLLTAFPQSDSKYTETKTVTVEVLEHYDVAISLDENEKSGKPEDILTFEAAVRNLGNIEDTYDITVEGGEEWGLSPSAESITVSLGGAGTVTISVTVPFEACPGDSTSFEVQAASRGDPSLIGYVDGTAIATAIYDFSITAHSELEQGSPGSEVTILLELRNLGTAPDTFDLEVKNAVGWDIEVDLVRNDGSTIHVVDFSNGISFENGETGKVAVRVRIPEDALIGQTKGITIQAVSRGDPRVSAVSSISVVVVTPFWEQPDVRFLIGLIIGALVSATLTGSMIFRRAPIIRRRSRKS